MECVGFPPVEEVEELSQELVRQLSSGYAEGLLRRGLACRESLDGQIMDTQRRACALDGDLSQVEAGLCQRLARAQADVRRLQERGQELDRELGQAQRALSSSRDRSQELRRAEQELQEQLRQLEREEQQQEEEEEQSLPPDVYVAQLYYEISRIDWDYSAEPGRIRGIHYGPDIAVPLELAREQHSGTFVSDFLWGLVPTQWGPRRAPPEPPRDPPAP